MLAVFASTVLCSNISRIDSAEIDKIRTMLSRHNDMQDNFSRLFVVSAFQVLDFVTEFRVHLLCIALRVTFQ